MKGTVVDGLASAGARAKEFWDTATPRDHLRDPGSIAGSAITHKATAERCPFRIGQDGGAAKN